MNDVHDPTPRDSATPEAWRDRVLAGVGSRLDHLVASHEITDFSSNTERVAVNAMVDAVQSANRINDRLGAFYTTERVRNVLGGVSRQAVSQRVGSNRLLRVTTADGEKLFPAFQFKGDRVLPGLQDLLRILLDSGADSWTVAYWLTAGIGQFEGATALDVLHCGDVDQIAELKALAEADAAGWDAAA